MKEDNKKYAAEVTFNSLKSSGLTEHEIFRMLKDNRFHQNLLLPYLDEFVSCEKVLNMLRLIHIIENFERIDHKVKKYFFEADDYHLELGAAALDLLEKGRAIGSATVKTISGKSKAFHDIGSLQIKKFWIQGKDGEPIELT